MHTTEPILHIKKRHYNPRYAEHLFCTLFLSAVTVLIAFLTWYYVRTTARLDAPSAAVLETHEASIVQMEEGLDRVQRAIDARTKGE